MPRSARAAKPARSFRSARYFDLLRNYRRHGWIVSYLFGVSPALCRSFLQGRSDAGLEPLGADTLIGPYATSLRMSDIGYRNRNPAAAPVSVNSLEEYLRDLRRAISAPYAPFAGARRQARWRVPAAVRQCAADRERVLQLRAAQAHAACRRAHHRTRWRAPASNTSRCARSTTAPSIRSA